MCCFIDTDETLIKQGRRLDTWAYLDVPTSYLRHFLLNRFHTHSMNSNKYIRPHLLSRKVSTKLESATRNCFSTAYISLGICFLNYTVPLLSSSARSNIWFKPCRQKKLQALVAEVTEANTPKEALRKFLREVTQKLDETDSRPPQDLTRLATFHWPIPRWTVKWRSWKRNSKKRTEGSRKWRKKLRSKSIGISIWKTGNCLQPARLKKINIPSRWNPFSEKFAPLFSSKKRLRNRFLPNTAIGGSVIRYWSRWWIILEVALSSECPVLLYWVSTRSFKYESLLPKIYIRITMKLLPILSSVNKWSWVCTDINTFEVDRCCGYSKIF